MHEHCSQIYKTIATRCMLSLRRPPVELQPCYSWYQQQATRRATYINTASLNDDTESLLVRWHVQRTQNRPCVCVIAASQYCHVKSEQQHHHVFKDRHLLHALVVASSLTVVHACVPSSPRDTVLRPPSSVQSSRPAGRCTAPCKWCVVLLPACTVYIHVYMHGCWI